MIAMDADLRKRLSRPNIEHSLRPNGEPTNSLPELSLSLADEAPSAGPEEELAQQVFGRLELSRLSGETTEDGVIGRGGQAIVYSYVQHDLGREVAVKTLRPENRSFPEMEYLIREACVTARLEHPNIVPVYALHLPQHGADVPFWVMKRIRGRPLSEHLPGAACPWRFERLMEVFRRVADAVTFAHSHGVIHRDLKPANILVGEFGEVQVTDWGLAVAVREESGPSAVPLTPQSSEISPAGAGEESHSLPAQMARLNEAVRCGEVGAPRRSETGGRCGTPCYMAPEQLDKTADPLDERTDVFQLGGLLYAMLTGTPPHRLRRDGDATEVLESRREAIRSCSTIEPPRTRRRRSGVSACPEGLSQSAVADLWCIIKEALDADMGQRPETVEELTHRVQQWQKQTEAHELCAEARERLDQARSAGADRSRLYAEAAALAEAALERVPVSKDAESVRRNAHEALLQTHRRSRRRLVLAIGAGLLVFVVGFLGYWQTRRERTRAVQQRDRALKAETETRRKKEALARTLQSNLANLARAQFSQGKYAATVRTAYELKDTAGSASMHHALDPSILRPAVWMNPLSGRWDTEMDGCRRLEIGPKGVRLRIFTERQVGVWDMQRDRMERVIELPWKLVADSAVAFDADGNLWVGKGSDLYCCPPGTTDFQHVLDIETLDVAPLRDVNDAEDPEAERIWMRRTGRHFPVTALFPAGNTSRLALVLGNTVVCWVEPEAGRILGWSYGFDDNRAFRSRPKPDRAASHIRVSRDEKWLLWGPGRGPMYHLFRLPGLRHAITAHNREYPLHALRFAPEGQHYWCIGQQGLVWSPRVRFFQLAQYGLPDADVTWELDTGRVACAAFSPDLSSLCVLTESGQLIRRPARPGPGTFVSRHVLPRDWVDCVLTSKGDVLAVTSGGMLFRYDVKCFAPNRLSTDREYLSIVSGHRPGLYYGASPATETKSPRMKESHLVRITVQENGNSVREELITESPDIIYNPPEGPPIMAADPRGRFLATKLVGEGKVYDLDSEEVAFEFELDRWDVSALAFDPSASLFAFSGWNGVIRVHRTSDWKCVYDRRLQQWVYDLFLTRQGNGTFRLFFSGIDPDYRVECVSLPDGVRMWHRVLPKKVHQILPGFRTDTKSLWVRNHYGTYRRLHSANGRTLQVQTTWHRRAPELEATRRHSDLTALITRGNKLHLCLKQDLIPLTDPSALDIAPQRQAMDRGGRRLLLVQDGDLFRLDIDRWRRNPVLKRNVSRLLGSEVLDGVDWDETD
jgi:serine/threonine protein kinase